MSKDAAENLMARTVAGARSGVNEYELHDHRRGQNYLSTDVQCMVDFSCHVAVVQWHRNKAALHAGQVVKHQLRAIRHERGNPIARRETELNIVACQQRGHGVELSPCPPSASGDQRVFIRLGGEANIQYRWKADVRVQGLSGNGHGDPRSTGEKVPTT